MYSIPQRVTSSAVVASGQAGQVNSPQSAVLNTADQVTRRANILMWVAGISAIVGAGTGVYVGMKKHR